MGCTGTRTGENVSEDSGECAECGETGNTETQKRSIHERLEEKKQIVEQQPKKKKQRNGMEL